MSLPFRQRTVVTNDGTTCDGGMFFAKATNGDQLFETNPIVVACFAAGSGSPMSGEVAVEYLRLGNRVRTVIGGKPEPTIWIGHRTIDWARHPEPKQAWPVPIGAGTFGHRKPSRDLFLSPDHAVYVEGVLVPVKHLINGSSIVQVPRVNGTHYHVELARHDVVLADGLSAESYLAGADGGVSGNDDGTVTLHTDLSSRIWEAEGCAPLVVTGAAFEAVRRRVKLPGRRASRRSSKAA